MQYKGIARDKAIKTSISIIRDPFAWPGGYEKIAITDDGEVLCRNCVKDNLAIISNAEPRDGWLVIGSDIVQNIDEPVYCAHCGRIVE